VSVLVLLVALASLPVSASVASSPVQAGSSTSSSTPSGLQASSSHPVNRTRGTPTSGFWNNTHGLGLLPGSAPVSKPTAKGAQLLGVPGYFSWNSYFGGSSYMTPVKNQGGCGSCWDFAAVGAMEAQYQIGVGNPSTGVDLSEQNVLSCSGGSCSGWYIDQALAFLYTSGTPDEACNPYTGTDSSCGSGRCSDYLSRTYRITGWSSIPTDTATIKNYLYTHGPVIVAMPVFCANPSCTTYDIPWYDTTFWQYYFYAHGPSSPYGYKGHAVIIVGWDDQGPGTADDYWIVRNSWGTSGGDVNSGYGGYFYMTQDPTTGFFGVYNEAYSILGVTAPPPVTITVTSRSTTNPISYLSMTTTSTLTSYTSTSTLTSTIPTVTTVALVPFTTTSTALSTEYLSSTETTTVTSYTSTTTSTSTGVVYTTVTVSQGGAGADASSPLAYLGFISLLAITAGHRVTAGRSWRIPRSSYGEHHQGYPRDKRTSRASRIPMDLTKRHCEATDSLVGF